MRKKRKRLRSLGRKPIFRIPKDKLTPKGEYSLKDDEGLQNCPKEPLKPTLTPEEIQESEEKYQKFIDSIKKEIKKGLKKKSRRAKPKK